MHLLHGAAGRESLTALGKYHRILNSKGVWEMQRVSRDTFSGFSKYLICQMMATQSYRLNPRENVNEISIFSGCWIVYVNLTQATERRELQLRKNSS